MDLFSKMMGSRIRVLDNKEQVEAWAKQHKKHGQVDSVDTERHRGYYCHACQQWAGIFVGEAAIKIIHSQIQNKGITMGAEGFTADTGIVGGSQTRALLKGQRFYGDIGPIEPKNIKESTPSKKEEEVLVKKIVEIVSPRRKIVWK